MARIIVSSPVFFQGHGCSEKNSSIYVWREKHLDIFPRVLYFISKTAKSFSHTTEAENIIFTIECIFTQKRVKVVEYVWTVDPILLSAAICLCFSIPLFCLCLSLFCLCLSLFCLCFVLVFVSIAVPRIFGSNLVECRHKTRQTGEIPD